MVEVLLPGYYVPSLIGVACDSRVINDMLKVRPATSHCHALPSGSLVLPRCYLQLVCPRLSNHFDLLSMPLDLVVNEWLMCAFATLYPSHTVLHLWDAMLLEVQQSRPCAAPAVVDSILLTQSCYVLYCTGVRAAAGSCGGTCGLPSRQAVKVQEHGRSHDVHQGVACWDSQQPRRCRVCLQDCSCRWVRTHCRSAHEGTNAALLLQHESHFSNAQPSDALPCLALLCMANSTGRRLGRVSMGCVLEN